MWEKFKNWVKDNIPLFATIVALLSGLFIKLFGVCSGRNKRLDANQQLRETAETAVTRTTESVGRASDGVKSAETTVGELKQSIASSEVRLGDSKDTVTDIIRNTDKVEQIINKYNK